MRPVTARRLVVSSIAAALLAVLPATATAKSPGPFTLPAGDTFTLSSTYLWGCDPDSYGYRIGRQPRVILGTNAGSLCQQDFQPPVTVGPFTSTHTFRLLLIDGSTTPADTFFSTNGNHTAITGPKDNWQVQIGDSNFGAAPPSVAYHAHNLSTTLSIVTGCALTPTAPDAGRAGLGGRPRPNC
jgi:hypothetical protein